jgi:NADH-quinone oxidoreductase subunit G
MEYYLLNHPLDCPVCDKAGECYLQDYTEEGGPAASRMVEEKQKNPKKDIGPHTLLYQDRCVLCSRCVRFADEIAGSGELRIVNRGSRGEIDVFPGVPLENPIQGNVVDLCPVGALLDKGFLFQQRVWLLKSTKSVSPVDSQGQTIWIDWNEQGLHRIRPRFNEKVNQWWISDEARFAWREYERRADRRLRTPGLRQDGQLTPVSWEQVPQSLKTHLEAAAGGGAVACVLSPMLSCEEAWLLARYIRSIAPQATLVLGHVPIVGEDRTFPKGFVIKAEKCPNRRGIQTIIEQLGGPSLEWKAFLGQCAEGGFKAAYVTGGYPQPWLTEQDAETLGKLEFFALHDIFYSPAVDKAHLVLPGATWAEREGSFMNGDGLLQAFDRALPPAEGIKPEGHLFHEWAGAQGLYRGRAVREQMAAEIAAMQDVFVPQDLPEHAH